MWLYISLIGVLAHYQWFTTLANILSMFIAMKVMHALFYEKCYLIYPQLPGVHLLVLPIMRLSIGNTLCI